MNRAILLTAAVLFLAPLCLHAQSEVLEGGPDKLSILFLLRHNAFSPLMLELDNVAK